MDLRPALLGVLLAAPACSQDGDFECAQDEECVSGNIAGVCQNNNYCSFPDPACDSGQRYAQHAPSGFAEECVPADVASSTESATSGGSGSGSGASSGRESSGGETPSDSSDSGTVDIDDSCVDVELGSELGIVDSRNFSQEDDDLTPSCGGSGEPDVVYLFVAPVVGTYRFRALGEQFSVYVSLWESCGGSELRCDEGLFDPFASTTTFDLAQGEPIVVSVDTDDPESQFELEITLVPE